MTNIEQFFYDHAGYSYGPTESPEQGKRNGAKRLALAETRALWPDSGLTFEWVEDDEPFACECENPDCESHDPHTAYGCVLWHYGDVVESLWGISFGPGGTPFPRGADANYGNAITRDPFSEQRCDPYVRVVQVELAVEYFATLDRLLLTIGPDPFGLGVSA